MNVNRTCIYGIYIATGLGAVSLQTGWDWSKTEAVQKVEQGRVSAPDFTLKTLDGKTLRLSDYRGQVVVLNFWATWCPPCREEIPDFIALYRAYKDAKVAVIGIALNDEADNLRSFSEKFGIPYPIVMGNEEVLAVFSQVEGVPSVLRRGSNEVTMGNGGIQVIPTTFTIDREGNIYRKHVGLRKREDLEPEVNKLLGLE